MDREQEELKSLLLSPAWPAAASPELICNRKSEKDKLARAEAIADLMIDVSLEGLAFLDFGCGEGHVVKHVMAESPRAGVGYDTNLADTQDPAGGLLLTSNFARVSELGPYDVILLHDVLDHLERMTPDQLLQALRRLAAPGARIYVRCHPWSSRHGAHLYHSLNKAFVQLVFDGATLQEICGEAPAPQQFAGGRVPACYRRLFPRLPGPWRPGCSLRANPLFWARKSARNLYTNFGPACESLKAWLTKSGIPAGYERIYYSPVEAFFRDQPLVRARIMKNWKGCSWQQIAPQLEISFIDYVIEMPRQETN